MPAQPARRWDDSRGWQKPAALIVAVLALVVGALQLELTRDSLEPAPPRLSGSFNIVIAQYGDGAWGARSADAISSAVSEVAKALRRDRDLKSRGFTIDMAGPNGIARITGDSLPERGDSAARIVEETGADLVVYAAPDATLNRVVLGVLLSQRTLVGSEEIAGAYEWFSHVTADDAFSNVVVSNGVAADVAGATQGLINFAVGLAYRDAGEDRLALRHFRAALTSDLVPTFQSMTQVFVGNAAMSLGRVKTAAAAFEQALRSTTEGAPRALLGSTEIMFLRGSGDCTGSEQEERLLEIAQHRYDSIATAASLDLAVRARALFGSGRALLCLASGSGAPVWDQATARFNAVTALYEAAPLDERRRLFTYAAESHAALGLADLLQTDGARLSYDDWSTARWHYEEAIALIEHWRPSDTERLRLFRGIVAFIAPHERPEGSRLSNGEFDLSHAGAVLPRRFVKRQVRAEFGGDGSPCDSAERGEPEIELLSDEQGVVEIGESAIFCFNGFTSERDLDVELLVPGSEEPQLVDEAAQYGWAKTFLPPAPLGRYTATAKQEWLKASITFEVVPPSIPRLVDGDSPSTQTVHLVGFEPGSVAFLNLYRTKGVDGTGEYTAHYVRSLPVPVGRDGAAVFTFPDYVTGCAEYRIGTIPPSEWDVSSTIAETVCLEPGTPSWDRGRGPTT